MDKFLTASARPPAMQPFPAQFLGRETVTSHHTAPTILRRVRRHLSTLALAAAAVVAPGAAMAATFSYGGLHGDSPVAIPDAVGSGTPGAEASASIEVSGLSGTVSSLTVSIDGSDCTATQGAATVGISHSWVGDLVISLRSPNGTVVPLISRLGSIGGNFGHSANNFCQLTLDDDAATSIQAAPNVEPITGTWKPNSPLSAFLDETANGEWELLVQDFAIGDRGNIRAWSIHLNEAPAAADLSITKTDGVTTATPGGNVTYTITASNAGPSNASGATVADTLPASLTGTWTCVGTGGGTCTAAGSGNISDTVNLPAGGSVTYTVNATVSPSATGTLSNTATVSSGVTDPNPGNNSATDTDTLAASADLSITKTNGVTTATPGGNVTYTITASNAGPSNVTGATVADTLPASLTGTWTCVGAGGGTCTAAGSGNLSDTVNLPAGGSVTYTVNATVSPSATGTLSNTATVASGVTDPNPVNNSATDTDTLAASADLSILQSPTTATATVGGTVTYTLTAHNAGPSAATGATVADTLPAGLTNATWTCTGSGGGTCTASGSGAVADTVNLPAGASVVYTVNATVNATGALSNTATVAAPAGVVDPTSANNSTGGTVTASAAAPRPVPSLSAGALGLLAGLLMLGAWRRRVH